MSYSEYTFAVTFANGVTGEYTAGGRTATDALFVLIDNFLDEDLSMYEDLKQGGDILKVEYVRPDPQDALEAMKEMAKRMVSFQEEANRILAEETKVDVGDEIRRQIDEEIKR